MTKKEVVTLCLKMLGIYIFVTGTASLSDGISVLREPLSNLIYVLLNPIIYMVIGFVLFLKAPNLCHYIIEFSDADKENLKISANEQTARIALLVLGFYVFTYSIPYFIDESLKTLIYYQRMKGISSAGRGRDLMWISIVPPIAEMLIGAVLIIGPDKVIRFIARFDDTFQRQSTSNKANSGDS